MIYGTMVLESNFNKLVDPIETIREYYENEILLLNECIYAFNEDGDSLITVDNKSSNETTKSGFLKNIIERLKEILKKFIEWCKKIYYSIKNFIVKDSDGIKKDLTKVVKNIQNATSISELKKYGKQVGFVRKYKESAYVMVFDTQKYIKDLNDEFKSLIDELFKINKSVDDYINILDRDGKLSESDINELEKLVTDLKSKIINNELNEIKKDNYYTPYASLNPEMTVEALKERLIYTAQTAFSSIDYIDTETQNAINAIKTLENNASKKVGELNKLTRNDIVVDRESINAISKLINATTSAGKHISQARIKKLNSIKNIYRIGTENSYMINLMKI